MIYDDNEGRPPFHPIWLTYEYAYEVDAAGELIDPPDDHTRAVVVWLARTHPHWEAAQIKLEIEDPPPDVDYQLPPGIDISEMAIAVVVEQVRQNY